MRKTIAYVAVALLFGEGIASADFFADFSKGEVRADFPIRMAGADNNPYYKGSHRLLSPNESFIEGRFVLPNRPNRVVLTLKHLSALSKGSDLDGQSPVTILINGNPVVRNLDPGSHGYVKDTFEITKYVQEGNNTIRIEYGNGSTHYWIKWLLIETD